MTMRWLMAMQEAGMPCLALRNGPAGIEFNLAPRWVSSDPNVVVIRLSLPLYPDYAEWLTVKNGDSGQDTSAQ